MQGDNKRAAHPVRIAIVGPESCGKSTLARALAARLSACGLRAALVPEFARAYYRDRPYRPVYDDVLAIAAGQRAAEEAAAASADVLVCDTTVLTCRIWADVVFGGARADLLALDAPHDYALTVLCRPDIPWEPDPLRSHPDDRDALFALHLAALRDAGVMPLEAGGSVEARLAACMAALAVHLPVF